ncbi:hypothetical protein [Nonomuraea salmonea]|uniref:hypothetical protein n=1 Tax=Nonomuraea salmonea TaxID=46181 RepID=UPI0031E8C7C5
MYVAKNGSDDAKGTLKDPFATIERARDALAGRTSRREPGIVHIREGVYQSAKTIEVKGAEHSYVTYAAYPGEQVELAGVTTLAPERFRRLSDLPADDAKWSSKARVPAETAPNVWVYDLGAEGIPTGTLHKNGFNWKPQPYAPRAHHRRHHPDPGAGPQRRRQAHQGPPDRQGGSEGGARLLLRQDGRRHDAAVRGDAGAPRPGLHGQGRGPGGQVREVGEAGGDRRSGRDRVRDRWLVVRIFRQQLRQRPAPHRDRRRRRPHHPLPPPCTSPPTSGPRSWPRTC